MDEITSTRSHIPQKKKSFIAQDLKTLACKYWETNIAKRKEKLSREFISWQKRKQLNGRFDRDNSVHNS